MNGFRLLAVGAVLIFALTASARQTASGAGNRDEHGQKDGQDGLPKVETQLKILTEKLDLTGEQQAKIKPVLQELHEATENIVGDKSLSPEERLAKVRPYRYKADKRIREVRVTIKRKSLISMSKVHTLKCMAT